MAIFITAEIGINHNGDLGIAKDLIKISKEAGCDAVKFQKRTIDLVYSQEVLDSPRESPWGTTQREQKEGLEFGLAEYQEIDRYCKEVDIEWFASAWDMESLKFLDQFNLKYQKIASAMIVDQEFLRASASRKKYTFISTGMCELADIDKAVSIFQEADCPFELMHCISTYPMEDSDANLNCIHTLRERYQCKVGYSGHESGLAVSYAAAALGITSLERHITLNRAMYGSDQSASVEPSGLRQLVGAIRKIELAMGDGKVGMLDKEVPIAKKLRAHINSGLATAYREKASHASGSRSEKAKNKSHQIGVMQGRLLPKYQGLYHAHPVGYWQKEFDLAAELKLDLIEFVLDTNSLEVNPLMSKSGIAEIQTVSQQSGVSVRTVCANCFMDAPFHSENNQTVEQSLNVLRQLMEHCAQLGVTNILIPCLDEASMDVPARERFVNRLQPALDWAKEYQIHLALETDLAPREFLALLNQFDSPQVTVNYDTGNSAALGFDPAEELATYGSKITGIHIKDRTRGGGSTVLGTGDTDFDAFFQALSKTDYQGPFTLEVYRDDEGLQIFQQQLDWIRPKLQAWGANQ